MSKIQVEIDDKSISFRVARPLSDVAISALLDRIDLAARLLKDSHEGTPRPSSNGVRPKPSRTQRTPYGLGRGFLFSANKAFWVYGAAGKSIAQSSLSTESGWN